MSELFERYDAPMMAACIRGTLKGEGRLFTAPLNELTAADCALIHQGDDLSALGWKLRCSYGGTIPRVCRPCLTENSALCCFPGVRIPERGGRATAH